MTIDPGRCAVLALHWQVNVIKPGGSVLGGHDRIVDNQKLSGLAGNDLISWLAERGIGTVFVTGVATNLVVEQTARHGTDLGLTVHPVSDCVAAASDAVHRASLANLDLTTAGCLSMEQVLERLGRS